MENWLRAWRMPLVFALPSGVLGSMASGTDLWLFYVAPACLLASAGRSMLLRGHPRPGLGRGALVGASVGMSVAGVDFLVTVGNLAFAGDLAPIPALLPAYALGGTAYGAAAGTLEVACIRWLDRRHLSRHGGRTSLDPPTDAEPRE